MDSNINLIFEIFRWQIQAGPLKLIFLVGLNDGL